jgi:intraflagellar transport protein 172
MSELNQGNSHSKELEKLLQIAHLETVASVAQKMGLKRIRAKAKVALLRYIGTIPIDRAFYEAGEACRDADWQNMQFVFLNRFVDVSDLIDDPSSADIDNSDFLESDIPNPFEVPLPSKHTYSDEIREEIREFVLETAMSNSTSQSLTQRTCDNCGSRTYSAALTCHSCGHESAPCIVTGKA